MQGETRLAQQGATQSRGWRKGFIIAAALIIGVFGSPAQAQRNHPPSVTLSAASTAVAVGSSVLLTAAPDDMDGVVVRVVFYDGGVMLGQSSGPPWTLNFTPSVAGVHNVNAVAIDNMLAQGTSNTIAINATMGGNASPTVTLAASPTTVPLGTGTVLTAAPVDTDGTISKVVFLSGGSTVLGQATSSPWQLNYTPANAGVYVVTAVAYDNNNATGTSNAVSVTADNGRLNNPPTVTLASSSNSITVGQSATLTATALDSDGTISKVEFYNGFTLSATDTSNPYTYTFVPAAAGTYNLSARAFDNQAASGNSNTVTITVAAGGGGTPPSSTLPRVTLSLNNTLFSPGATITLSATATAVAPAAVARVSFYMNGSKLVDDAVSPYSTTATLPSVGDYTFYAVVTDTLNQTQTTLQQVARAQVAPAVVTSDPDVWRLLNQATFGASQKEAARVASLGGIAAWINDQMTQPISGYPDAKYNRIQLSTSADCTTSAGGVNYPADSPQAVCARDHLTLAMLQRDFFTNALYAPDQLRQRVAWALSQIIVTSANEPDLSYAHVMSRFQNLMFNNAFGNYETLLRQVTYSPAMGNYLDMVNNDRAPQAPTTSTRVPNENYAREIMQLFSINLDELNIDGTPVLDAQGNKIQTYGQTEIAEFAKIFTGYTYASAANPNGPATGKTNTRYYAANMIPYPTTATTGHEPSAKNLLNGTVIPAGQTAQQDIDAAVRNVFMHPNTPVYVGRQLIQRLVTGDPTPAYVARVANVFVNNGQGVRGDLGAVVKAILLDSEARGGVKSAANFGSLREPVLMVTAMLRALDGWSDGSRIEGATANLGQRPFYAPTVFNYFMPDAKVPGTSVLGPEFGIHTTVTAVGRANLVYTLVYGGYNPDTTIPDSRGTKLFLAPFEAIADNPAAMVSLVNQRLAGGQFPVALEPTIVTAVNAITISATPTAAERTNRARMAVYLMASSYDYQVQR